MLVSCSCKIKHFKTHVHKTTGITIECSYTNQFPEIAFVCKVSMSVCVSVSAPEAINSYDNEPVYQVE